VRDERERDERRSLSLSSSSSKPLSSSSSMLDERSRELRLDELSRSRDS
jgi:hypothetical protein